MVKKKPNKSNKFVWTEEQIEMVDKNEKSPETKSPTSVGKDIHFHFHPKDLFLDYLIHP